MNQHSQGRKQACQNGYPTRPQASHNRRRSFSHPPTPELPRQLVSRVGYVEDCDEPRTTFESADSVEVQDGQNGFQQGPRREETGSVPSGYVEDFFEPRTKLEDIFTILLSEEGHDGQTDE